MRSSTVESKGHAEILIVIIVMLGFLLMLTPSILTEPNFRGIPTIPLTFFVFAVTLYSIVAKQRKVFCATIVILLIVFAYVGFWFYNYKMPLSNLSVTMVPTMVRNHPTDLYFRGNQCDLSFNLTIRNPTNVDTPPFMIQGVDFYIDDVKLKLRTCSMWDWGQSGAGGINGYWYYGTHIIIKANQAISIGYDSFGFRISIYSNGTEVEGSNFESIWEKLVAKNFTISMKGFFTSRPDFQKGDFSPGSMWILAMAPFTGSCRFSDV